MANKHMKRCSTSLIICCSLVASLVSDSVRPHRQQPTRVLCLWDSPGKNTGVGCHFLLQSMNVKIKSEVAQSCRLFATPWTAAYQAPLSMGFSRQENWSGVPFIWLSRVLVAAWGIFVVSCRIFHCGAQVCAQVWLWHTGSVVAAHGFCSCGAWA